MRPNQRLLILSRKNKPCQPSFSCNSSNHFAYKASLNKWFTFFFNFKFCRVSYGDGIGVVSQQLYTVLTRLQMGLSADEMNWTVELR